jgi:hypothetical protein
MIKALFKWLILTNLYGITMSLYGEYIVNKPIDGYIQIICTITVVMITAGMLRYAVKDLLKLKNKFK